jgi:predicted ATP-grasp superfamily ATP-dependent carboligase
MIEPALMPPVIIVGAHTVGLGVIRAFRDQTMERVVLSYDHDDMGRVSRYLSRLLDAPHPENQQEKFIAFLINLANDYQGAMLLPASDASLKAISYHKAELSQYYTVACTDWTITQQFIDKKLTYALAEKTGVPAPHTLIPHSEADVEQYAQTVVYPCLVKPCESHVYFDHFHHKMVRAQNFDQMMKAYRDAADAGLEVMLQEFIQGDDADGVNYNAYYLDGEPLVEFTARKIRNAPPQLGSPCVAVSADEQEVIAAGRRILKAMGFYGFACTEFKQDIRDGVYKLMEVNGRHNLSGALAVYCGVNFPLIHYRHLMLGEIPSQLDYRKGIYWIDLTRDWAYHLKRVLQRKYPWKKFITPYQNDHIFAILDSHDMSPFMKRVRILVRDGLSGKRAD